MAKRPKDRKASILEAAAALIAERGYAAVGIDDIGGAVGVSGPAVYRHFRGKQAVLAAIATEATSELDQATRTDPDVSGVDAVQHLVRGVMAVALDRPAFVATYIRERPRLVGNDAELRITESRILSAARSALSDVRPDLDLADLRMRREALISMVSAATSRHNGVTRPRLDDLLAQSAVAMLLAPSRPAPDTPERGAGWTVATGKGDEILAAAMHLVARDGFHGVGMDQIGEAVGITGPSVYHYFSSKAEVLVAAYDRVGERVAVGADRAVAEAESATDALDRLARSYTTIAAQNIDLIVATAQEGPALPEEDRPRLRRRRQAIRDRWSAPLRELRPDLNEAEVRLLVRIVLPLVNAAVRTASRREQLGDVVSMAICHCLGETMLPTRRS